MAIETQKFIRKPLYVDAVQITRANFDAVVAWCGGEVMQDDVPGRGRSKKYIKIDVHQPKNPRQTKAKVGDWLLKTEKGFKIYTDKAFHESFHLPEEDHRGDETVEENLISPTEEVVPGVTVNEAIRLLRAHAKIQDEVGFDVVVVPATPETIAEAVRENEEARAAYPEETTIGGTPREEIDLQELNPAVGPRVDEGEIEKKIADAVEPTSTKPVVEDHQVDVDGGVSINDSSSAPPPVHAGKRVLTEQEQNEMDPDEIRDLLKSGEVILAQDIAA